MMAGSSNGHTTTTNPTTAMTNNPNSIHPFQMNLNAMRVAMASSSIQSNPMAIGMGAMGLGMGHGHMPLSMAMGMGAMGMPTTAGQYWASGLAGNTPTSSSTPNSYVHAPTTNTNLNTMGTISSSTNTMPFFPSYTPHGLTGQSSHTPPTSSAYTYQRQSNYLSSTQTNSILGGFGYNRTYYERIYGYINEWPLID